MYFLRCSILLALCSAVSIPQSTSTGGASFPNNGEVTSEQQLDALIEARRVKLWDPSGLMTPEASVGTILLGGGLLTWGVLHHIDEQEKKNKKLRGYADADDRVDETSQYWTRALHMVRCYAEGVSEQEMSLKRDLEELELRQVWNQCLKRNGLYQTRNSEWAWASPRQQMYEQMRHNKKHPATGDSDPFTLESVMKATKPLMADLGRKAEQFGETVQQSAPAVMKMAASRLPAAMKLAAVP